jgi:hypothetical protein
MKVITFTGYEFDPKKLLNRPECPESLRAKMVKAILSSCPDDVDVKEFANTTTIARNGKKVNISVWKFNLSDWPDGRPFNYFHKDGSEIVFVWGVQFFDNGKFRSDINDNANLRCALGYPLAEENKALFMGGTKAMQWATQFRQDVKEFLSDADSLAQDIAAHMPDGATVKITPLSMVANFVLDENDVRVGYMNGSMTATVKHHYTETDLVYGARYANYSRTVEFSSKDEVDSFDWEALWDDLYKHRNGTCTYYGSLGT